MQDFLERISQYSPKRLALLAAELQGRVQQLERARHEPIAIVGMGCRLPGGADTPDRFWKLVSEGVDAISEVPADRWKIADYYNANPDTPGTMNTRFGGFVSRVDGFDPHFFGISPREARTMDPQQRLLLEVTWEAIEHAGIAANKIAGSSTGVFIGLSAADYFQLVRENGAESFDAYTASGTAHSIASGRLSYFLGATGPSISIDTACSSSMMAIHLAVQSLRRGECGTALAGGVNLILGPEVTIALSRSHMMAPDGRCKAFDSRADGFVRGEGCGMLVLKRLADAEGDGDRIVAVIRGSAANQDGRSNGLTAPNGRSQEAVLRDALADAQIDAADVAYVEAHGTGTSLGDPIEVQALSNVLGGDRKSALMIGSVKANIGHLEAAAGVAGVIKLVMALQHGEIPRQIHLQTPNPLIPWDEINVRVPTQRVTWPATDGARRIGGVSSFGFSGTNVHLLIERAQQAALPPLAAGGLQILAFSARQENALAELASRYSEWLADPSVTLADAAYSVNTGKSHFAHRMAVVAASTGDAVAALTGRANGGDTAAVLTGVAANRAPRIAFLFTGQGAQYTGMARELYNRQPTFRATIDRCNDLLKSRLPRSLLSVLFEDAPSSDGTQLIDDTQYTQPALFAVEYALATLWMSWGIQPTAVMGHSVGEYVAACVAGVFNLDDALTLVAARGRLMSELPRDGAMASVMCDERRVRAAIAPWSGELGVAAVNGPANVVISGRIAAVDAVTARLDADGIRTIRLNVSHAFHSPLVEPMIERFSTVARGLRFSPPCIDIVSNVTGRLIGAEMADAEYWCEHVRAPVLFAPAVQALADSGCQIFLEVGPHPTLLGMGLNCLPDGQLRWLPSLRRGRSDQAQMLNSLAELYVAGANVDWAGVDGGPARHRLVMPGYPFQRERFWVDPPSAKHVAPRETLHPLLGTEVLQSVSEDRLFEVQLTVARHPYLENHRILDALIVPSAVHIEMAVAAAVHALDAADSGVQIEDFVVKQAQPFDGSEPSRVQTVVEPPIDSSRVLRIAAHDPAERHWLPIAAGRISRLAAAGETRSDLTDIRARMRETLTVDAHYARLAQVGIESGARLRCIDSINRRDGEVLARMELPAELMPQCSAYRMHPALLDACFHAIGAALPEAARSVNDAFLLTHIECVRWRRPLGTGCWNHITVDPDCLHGPQIGETFRVRMQLLDDDGGMIVAFEGLEFKRARVAGLLPQRLPNRVREMLHEVVWREASLARRLSPLDLQSLLAPALTQLVAENELDRYADFASGLDKLVTRYIVKALRELGLALTEGMRVQEADVARLAVLPRHGRLFSRMLMILAEDGILAVDRDAWRVIAEPADAGPEALYAALYAEHPQCGAELELTRACANQLAGVLRGRIDPLGLLFPGGSLAPTERLYRDSPPARVYNGLIAKVVGSLVSGIQAGRGRTSSRRPIRILEIGAGTGSTTAHVMPLLPASVEYTFTDVSPAFLNRARELFSDHGNLKCALLDIARDPVSQGFTAGSYDIVLAANVVHATADLGESMTHVRQLLAPGGTLVLLEGTAPQRFGDVTVGLLEGWWAYTDTRRRSYALLSQPDWLSLFAEQGFAQVSSLPGTTTHPVLSQQQVFIAQVVSEPSKRKPSRWLIVPDATGLAQALAGSLAAAGDVADTLPVATSDALARGLREALADNSPVRGVVYLPALDAAIDESTDASTLMSRQQRLVETALATVQTMSSQVGTPPPQLWLVTRGGQHVGGPSASADPSQATLWGMSHVIAMEHPELRCVRVDLDPACGVTEAAAHLRDELQLESDEDQIAWRAGQRSVRRLVPAIPAFDPQSTVQIDGSKTYLITGGLRGLGLLVAQWLVDQGARHLGLMGRHEPDGQASEVLRRFASIGVQTVLTRGDVSLREDVESALAEIARAMPPLAGIVHAAGVLDDGVIAAQSWPRFASVMAPKLLGTWHLHWLTRDLPLDFMVLFSSGASLAGSPGQANHAAANAFEDAFAWYRQAQGRPTLAINWGPWSDIGAAAQRKLDHPAFLHQIAPPDGLLALEFALRRAGPGARFERAQLVVLAADWSLLGDMPGGAGNSSLFAELITAPPGPAGDRGAATPTARLAFDLSFAALRAAAQSEREGLVLSYLQAQAARVLGAKDHQLNLTTPLASLGFDSLMAVQLKNSIETDLGVMIPMVQFLQGPSVVELAPSILAAVDALEPLSLDSQTDSGSEIAWEEGSL